MRLPQEHLVVIRCKKVSPFVKFEIVLPLLCCLLDPLTNKYCRACISMINLWIDFSTLTQNKLIRLNNILIDLLSEINQTFNRLLLLFSKWCIITESYLISKQIKRYRGDVSV